MDQENRSPAWLLLLAQLPTSPSSARVALWRRLRAIGAAGLVNGAWILPHREAHVKFLEDLAEKLRKQDGTGFVLTVTSASPEVNEVIRQRFRTDRTREYDEFTERCTALVEEIGKETQAGKFIFAEMEEGEQDLEKLTRWLTKIQARDFFPDERWAQAEEMLQRCHDALSGLSSKVYAAEGIPDVPGAGQQDTGSGPASSA